MLYDVAIIGGGVVGCAVFNKLTRLGAKCVLIEKGADVAVGSSKANSGIVHAGFDAKTGTLKAKLNVRGSQLYPQLCKELKVPFVNNGALVIGNDIKVIEELYDRGIANGVDGLEILSREKLLKKLPVISDNITCGLFAKTSAIVSPYKFTIALAEEAVLNGGEVVFNFDITAFKSYDEFFELSDGEKCFRAKKIIVAVGSNHNEVAEILGTTKYDIELRLGEYYLLDKGAMDIGGYTIFPQPGKHSKGVLVTQTVSGNVIVGPTSTVVNTPETITTSEGLKSVATRASSMLSNVNLKKNIRCFAGVRTLVGDDFVIEEDPKIEGIYNVTGICSPGLSAAPGIAEYLAKLMGYTGPEKKMVQREEFPKINNKSLDEINKLISTDNRYGKIVCRCEMISEMEIINALNSPLRPMSLDAIKRRTRAGMGRCQGGFCFSKVMELIAGHYGISIDEVIKENLSSRIIVGDIK